MAKAKTKPASQPLPAPVEMELDVLRMDFGLQLRAEIDEFHVDRLADAYAANEPVPPIRVMHDSKTAWVWDGNHRMIGRRRAGFQTISCIVEHGTYRDAILRAAGANHEHGLPRSNRDKRAAVAKLLADKVWAKRSDRWIAETCRVSRPLVADVREDMIKTKNALESEAYEVAQVAELPPENAANGTPATREGQDGKTYQASKPKSAPAATVDLPPELQRAVRNTEAAGDPKQMARLARLAKEDPPLAETVANMLRDCEVSTVEEALVESDQPEPEPQQEASAVLRQMLEKTKSVWRIQCPKSASPALGAAVLEAVADEWLSGGWF